MTIPSADRSEHSDDMGMLLRQAMQGERTTMWTALPGFVVSFDPSKMTCKVQPTIQAERTKLDGSKEWVNLPVLVDCPVVFPSAGGFTLTFPIKANDEVLVIFSSRCIDNWWDRGGVQTQAEFRMHDLSDGFVIPGPHSKPKVVPNINMGAVELRNNAGTAHFSIANNGSVDVRTPGKMNAQAGISATVNAPQLYLIGTVHIEGTLDVSGLVTAPDFVTPVHNFNTHLHTNVRFGSDRSGPVFPG